MLQIDYIIGSPLTHQDPFIQRYGSQLTANEPPPFRQPFTSRRGKGLAYSFPGPARASPSKDNQSDVIEACNSTSRYLDDLLNIDNNFIDSMVNHIYPSELQLNKANVSDTEASFFDYIYLYRMVLSRLKFMINEMILILLL